MRVKFKLDDRSSRFVVKVRASGVLASLGHNPTIAIRRFSGWIECDVARRQNGSFQMVVPADSLEVVDDISKKDRLEIERRMRAEVLETSRYGEIRFTSSDVSIETAAPDAYQVRIVGDLSLHGVTKRKGIDARLRIRGDEARLSGGFTLLQSDYQIKRVTALAGALKVKDELSFEFEIVGVSQVS